MQYDLDRDGEVGFQDFQVVMHSLSQHTGKPLEPDVVRRMFALADRDNSGAIDLNEFVILRREMQKRRTT